jgi:hypothetical protein
MKIRWKNKTRKNVFICVDLTEKLKRSNYAFIMLLSNIIMLLSLYQKMDVCFPMILEVTGK